MNKVLCRFIFLYFKYLNREILIFAIGGKILGCINNLYQLNCLVVTSYLDWIKYLQQSKYLIWCSLPRFFLWYLCMLLKYELGAVLRPSSQTQHPQAHWAHKHWWCAASACFWHTSCNSSPQRRLPKWSLLQQLSWSNLSPLIDDTLSSRLISSYDSSWQPHCYWTM